MTIKIAPWIQDESEPWCWMRYVAGTDKDEVRNRVAFIEKSARVRVAPFDNRRHDSYNWEGGPRGTNLPALRAWCDAKLKIMGYELEDL